jgi:two component transcriptional regulator, winged helix family
VRQTEILLMLAENLGNIVERDAILERIWGDASYANSLALNVQITYLRRLLTDPTLVITSIKKRGYILSVETK